MVDFVHLHVHSQYSILDGACKLPDMIEKAISDGMQGVAVTDHGNMFGVKIFHEEACKQKYGLTGNRDTNILRHHAEEDDPIPVACEEVRQ